jgi:hypothetical protein
MIITPFSTTEAFFAVSIRSIMSQKPLLRLEREDKDIAIALSVLDSCDPPNNGMQRTPDGAADAQR